MIMNSMVFSIPFNLLSRVGSNLLPTGFTVLTKFFSVTTVYVRRDVATFLIGVLIRENETIRA